MLGFVDAVVRVVDALDGGEGRVEGPLLQRARGGAVAVDGLEGCGGVDGDEVWGEADDGAVFEVGVVQGEMAVAEVGVVDIVPGLGVSISGFVCVF